jgi:hypothetical protein
MVAAGILLAGAPAQETEIRLLVRVDDMGVAHGVNEACIRTFREGVARSVEVIVPGPWFLEAARMLKENPGFDVGIHLCLTSEWENVKWRPLTRAPSLADRDGYFFPMTRQRRDFPPETGFLDAKPRIEEVEAELRAQIEAARKHLPNLTHMSAHMGAATATPELRAITQKLAEEYKLPLEARGARGLRPWSGKPGAEEKEKALVEALEKLGPGTWIFVEHPGTDTPEMRAMGHKGYEDVASDREGVTRALTSEKVKAVVKARGIRLISYADLR